MLRRLFLAAIAVTAFPVRAQRPSAFPKFSPLSSEQRVALENQRRFVRALLQKHLPSATLRGEAEDLVALQSILDAGLIKADQTWELQALGVVFGDAIATVIPGLAWWSVTDEFGTDPTLRYRESSLQVNALTMIAKRVKRGEAVDVKELVSLAAEHISKSAGRYK